MSHIVSTKRNIRTLKALRGEALTIDLGKTQIGTLKAWMKKDPNDATFRSFEIKENRYLYLSKEKTDDYFNAETGKLIEAVEGRWNFDVRLTPEGEDEENDAVIYTGTILFKNQVTGSRGVEIINSNAEGVILA